MSFENEIQIRIEEIKETKNIIVTGATGSVKSAGIEILGGIPSKEHLEAKEEFSFQKYETIESLQRFFEVPGVTNTTKWKRIRNIMRLIKSFQSGVSILICVIEMGRLTKDFEQTYNILVNGICLSQVPIILVITHCDTENEPEDWWKENRDYFEIDYGMKFADVLSVCCSRGDGLQKDFASLMSQRFVKSKTNLQLSVRNRMLENSWKTDSWRVWLQALKNSLFNVFWSADIKNGNKMVNNSL